MKAFKGPTSAEQLGQEKALLQDFEHDSDGSDEDFTRIGEQRSSPLRHGYRSWLWCCSTLVIMATIVLSIIVWRDTAPSQNNAPKSDEPQLAIDLHPDEHNFRQPTTLIFEWNITSGHLSPDGTRKKMYLVNDEFPGPLIEARSGDRIVVHVTNSLPGNEGVSLHWHGLQLRGYNDMDGAVGITQCPILAGQTFTYDFRIGDDEHGTFWWHSHAQFQRADGLYGGLVVHKPVAKKPTSTEKEALLLIGDWFHEEQKEVFAHYSTPLNNGKEPILDGVLVNGQGQHHCRRGDADPCSDGGPEDLLPILRNTETTKLRIVNTGTVAGMSFAMDDATFRVIEVDGGCPVEAPTTNSLGILYPGERMDVMLDWSSVDSKNSPQFRIKVDDENFLSWHQKLKLGYTFPALPESRNSTFMTTPPEGIFQIGSEAHFNLANLTSSTIESNFSEDDEAVTIVFFVKTLLLNQYHIRPLGHLNNTFWKPQDTPLLGLNRSSWDKHQNMPFVSTSTKPKRVNLIINNHDDGAHAFHLHGHNFHVISSFQALDRYDIPGTYNPYRLDEGGLRGWVNYKNPVRKDTILVPSFGYVWVTFMADNPGLWLLHCHMMVHQAGGMAAGFHVGAEDDYEHVKAQNTAALQLCKAK